MSQVVLVGNPNTGKTSLFNTLTGSYEYVGNWSGVTIEKKIGLLKNKKGTLVDLPGIYSLNPISQDEGIAASFLLSGEFNQLINIIDAAQLERNLHLTLQLLEYGAPTVIGLNMMDIAERQGIAINIKKLSKYLECPVQEIMARTGKGCHDLLTSLEKIKPTTPLIIDYGSIIEEGIQKILSSLPKKDLRNRWIAIQTLEENAEIIKQLQYHNLWDVIQPIVRDVEKKLLSETSKARNLRHWIYQQRKIRIQEILQNCVSNQSPSINWSNRIDELVTHRILGIPIFLFTMFLMFKLTFDWIGTPVHDWMDDALSGPLTAWIKSSLSFLGVSPFIQSVILDGIVPGVGGVLVFLPQIIVLFLIISLIEDTGYMARIAMVMDRLMELVGLNGKAFIPMIIGFGCNVPGVMATRTVEQPRERLLTLLLTPLMSCSARLSVYGLFVGVFFSTNQALVVWSLYVLGIIIALILSYILAPRILQGEHSVFVVELPPYRVPQIRTLFRSTWEKGKGFVIRAGTYIFGGSVIIWLLGFSGPKGWNVEISQSFLAMIGQAVAYMLEPLGFGNWQAGASLLTGFLAKEVVVSTMNIIYAASTPDQLRGLLTHFFTPLQAYSFMAYTLLYIPCLATVAVIKQETFSNKWTWFSIIYPLIIAYLVSLIIYQGGRLLGFQ